MHYHDLQKRIGSRIRKRRKELGLTQQALGGEEYTRSHISQIEKGQVWPSIPTLARIAQRLGRPITWFLEEEETVYRSPFEEIAWQMEVSPGKLREALIRILELSEREKAP